MLTSKSNASSVCPDKDVFLLFGFTVLVRIFNKILLQRGKIHGFYITLYIWDSHKTLVTIHKLSKRFGKID